MQNPFTGWWAIWVKSGQSVLTKVYMLAPLIVGGLYAYYKGPFGYLYWSSVLAIELYWPTYIFPSIFMNFIF